MVRYVYRARLQIYHKFSHVCTYMHIHMSLFKYTGLFPCVQVSCGVRRTRLSLSGMYIGLFCGYKTNFRIYMNICTYT